MTLGAFGGSEPFVPRISGGTGGAALADRDSFAKRQAYGSIGDLPIGYKREAARVFNSANLSIADNTSTDLTFDSDRFDADDLHSTTSNTGRITVKTAGTYLISCGVEWQANATGTRQMQLRVNDVTQITVVSQVANPATFQVMQNLVSFYELTAGDYVTIRVYQNSGGALNINASLQYSPEFQLVRVP